MVENPPNHESCDANGVKDPRHFGNEVEALGEKSLEIEDDEEADEPEIIIDTIVIPLEVNDDSSSDTSLRAVKLTRSAANESMRQEFNSISKPTEFVIVSAISESTVKFPDDVQIKDELAEPIATSCSPNNEDTLENDPMGLLEINDRSDVNSTRSNVEQDDGADDISSTCSSSIQTTTSTVNISDWAKDYPWLLHEECDEWYGYCLYCDVKLSVRSYKSAKHHGMSLYHQERCAHYLAFREEEEKNNLGTSVAEIKQEFGTDSYVAALKLKRKTQAEAFNNYNWRRWLEECSWLERDSSAGTIGLCKYCSVRLNVEFTYLRQRHQESGQHKERAKQYKKLCESKSDEAKEVTEGDAEDADEAEDAPTNGSANRQADADGDEEEPQTSKSDDTSWCLEPIDNATARCTLCDTVLKKRNTYKRHLQTQLHLHNEKNYLFMAQQKSNSGNGSLNGDKENGVPKTPINSWQMYAKIHSWMTADPLDSTFAYCKYCKKRLNYGSSAAKRATHENSFSHRANEKAYMEAKKKGGKQDNKQANEEDESAIDGGDEDGDDEEETEGVDAANEQEEEEKDENESDQEEEASEGEEGEEEQEDDADQEEENSEEEEEEEEKEEEEDEDEDNDQENNADEEESATGDANKSKKRILSTNAEWYSQYPWCKRYKKDPKYCFCSYCKMPITKGNRKKHGHSKRHFEAEKKFLRRKNRTEIKKGAKEEDRFEWAVDIKAQPNLYYCKCCRVRISKHYSKKQHAISKIHQINEKLYENRKNAVNPEPETKTTQPANPPAQSSQQRNETPVLRKVVVKGQSFITSIKQWQKRHSWLGYKLNELRSNYAYCKACEQSLFVRSFKNVIKHQRSSKHMRIVNQLKRDRQKEANNSMQVDKKTTKREADQNTSSNAADTPTQRENSGEVNNSTRDSAKGINYKSTIESMQKRYSWITKSSKPEHAYCRYCDEDVPLKIIFLRNHTNSRAHRRSVVNFGGAKAKTENTQQDEPDAADNEGEDDDDDDYEADDDVVLLEDNTEEILISEQDDNWTVKSENMDEHEALDCLLQRAGKSGQTSNNANTPRDDRKQAPTTDERPSKRFKRSHSFRRLNDSTNSSIISSILSTPLTLASCLGPLIQQQIQQATSLQQSSASPSATPAVPQPPLARTTEPENTYDLFFKSVSETMKKLPVDIAAEGKVKVMQIICDLELTALKRQQDQSVEQANNTILSSSPMLNAANTHLLANSPTSGNKTNSNVAVNSPRMLNFTNCNSNEQRSETNGNSSRLIADNNSTTSATDQYMGETVITPIYGGVNTSPTNRQPLQQHYQQQIQQKPQQTSVSTVNNPSYNAASSSANVTMDKNKSPNQAPIIGVMDMNGLQTLQLRNNPIVKQIPKQNLTATSGQSTGTTTSIRCIPFKNLTQNASADVNSKITRIQVPMPATSTPTSQSSQSNAPTLTNATKGLLNLRSIHITKRTSTNPQQQQPQTSTPVSVSVVNPITDKKQPTTYVQTSNMQRWTAVNGSISTIANKKPQQQSSTTTATFQVSAKHQNYTPINRNYK